MVNLLPAKRKMVLAQEARVRLSLILSVSGIASLLAFCLLVLALHFYVAGRIRTAELSLASFESRVAQLKRAEQDMRETNAELQSVAEYYRGQDRAVPVLELLTDHLPSSLSLRGFSFTVSRDRKSGKRQDPVVTATGYAASREALLLFRERLIGDPAFRDVEFPPANWVLPSDIQFSFTARVHDEP